MEENVAVVVCVVVIVVVWVVVIVVVWVVESHRRNPAVQAAVPGWKPRHWLLLLIHGPPVPAW